MEVDSLNTKNVVEAFIRSEDLAGSARVCIRAALVTELGDKRIFSDRINRAYLIV